VPKVLIADDSVVDRRLAGRLLENTLGCTVDYAANGKQALELLAQRLPDLVLCDLQMPEMDGLELVAAIKTDYPVVPVILMTAQGSEEIAAQALRRGAASYVPKRKLADDLAPTVQRILLGSQVDRRHSQLMHHLEASQESFVLDNDPVLLKALVHHWQQQLRCLALADETERLRVCVALEEALTNACYHGNLEVGTTLGQVDRRAQEALAEERRNQSPYRERRLRVTTRLSRAEAVFVIAHDGPACDVGKLPSAVDVAVAERGAGRGLALMRTIMDEVIYNDTCTQVTLVKRRVPEPVIAEDGA
jgi:CheY-like chemotaxis protein